MAKIIPPIVSSQTADNFLVGSVVEYSPVYLDRRVYIQGEQVDTNTNTTWTVPYEEDDLLVVTGPAWGTGEGQVITTLSVTPSAGSTVVKAGGLWSRGPVIIGRPYLSSLTASRVFDRDDNGRARRGDRVDMIRVYIGLNETGDLTLTRAARGRTRARAFSAADGRVESGLLSDSPAARAEDLVLTLSSSSHRPFQVPSIRYVADVQPGAQRL